MEASRRDVARRMHLEVPYDQGDDAKALGAAWDPRAKKWVIMPEQGVNVFSSWL